MQINVTSDHKGTSAYQISHLKTEMLELVEKYKSTLNFEAAWRNFVYEKRADGKLGKVDGSVSRLQKLRGSLKADLQELDSDLTDSLIRDVLVSVTKQSP